MAYDAADGATLRETGSDDGSSAPEETRTPIPVSIGSPESALRWDLPGAGMARLSCGEWRTTGHVVGRSLHYVKEVQSCLRRECPRCFRDWAWREADRVAFRVAEGMLKSRRHRAIHVVAAPPPALYGLAQSVDGFRALRDLAYRSLRASGFDGGAVFFHSHRLGSRWENSRSGGCVVGPHFHAVGDGWLAPLTGARLKAGEWVTWNLGVRQSVRATAFYLLTHTPKGNLAVGRPKSPVQSVTWMGSMGYARLRMPEPLAEGVPVRFCPVCGALRPLVEWFPVVWEGCGPPDAPYGVADGLAWRAEVLDRTAGGVGVPVRLEL